MCHATISGHYCGVDATENGCSRIDEGVGPSQKKPDSNAPITPAPLSPGPFRPPTVRPVMKPRPPEGPPPPRSSPEVHRPSGVVPTKAPSHTAPPTPVTVRSISQGSETPAQSAAAAAVAARQGNAPPRGFCKYWLPAAVFASKQDLRELISGPGGAHFSHVLNKYPRVELRIEGQASTAAPPAHRLHVSMSSDDSEVFETAAADMLDLIETVCDMVGDELGMTEDQVESLIREIRAEKYFEAHGIRTALPPARQVAPKPTHSTPDTALAPAVTSGNKTPSAKPRSLPSLPVGTAPPTPGLPVMGHHPPKEGTLDFEFVDEDLDVGDEAACGGDGDDARTEASDMLSDITDPGDTPRVPFDDI